MATRIVGEMPADLKYERDVYHDTYVGDKAALIAAGLAAEGQFPGDPGRGSTSCSYREDGAPVPRGNSRRQTALRITRCGKKFQVDVSVGGEEGERRRAEYLAELERRRSKLPAADKDFARRGLWADPGIDEAEKRAAQSPACFEVGDEVIAFGEYATIVKGYRLHRVAVEDGHYLMVDGGRGEYQFGYVIEENDSGKRYFAEAHKITRDDCKPAHLRLVYSRRLVFSRPSAE